ncbi:MAG: hypothetical protein K6T88_14585 [Bacillus sp. (in: Bacteria)]|nr:hypothetical protein [Bacillus sp. (in: firmicutes)]
MSRASRARGQRTTTLGGIKPPPAPPSPAGLGVQPIFQLPRISETVTSVLSGVLNKPPLNTEKSLNLFLLLTTLTPYPLSEASRNRLLQYLQTPPTTTEQAEDLINLLNELVKNQNTLPPDQTELVTMYIPISLENPQQFDIEKAKRLFLLLTNLNPYPLTTEQATQLLEFLRSPPTDDENITKFKDLLLTLKNATPQLSLEQAELVQQNIPMTLLTSLDLRELESLTYPNGEPILTLQDRNTLFEVVGLLFNMGYSETLEFLRRVNSSSDIIFNSPLMRPAHEKQMIDLEILRSKVEVTPGSIKCPRCGSNEIIYVEKQVRSADEPMTIFYTCVACNKKWKH